MVLNEETRIDLQKALEDQPTMLLSGKHGVGKGTFVDIFAKEIGCEILRLNSSLDTGIDSVRNKVEKFSTGFNLDQKMKFVYLNEVDWLSVNAQKSLLDLIDQVESITRFILVCNYPNKIMRELKSRCRCISFGPPEKKDMVLYLSKILKKESIKMSDPKILLKIAESCYPDIRQSVKMIQANCINGELVSRNFERFSDTYVNILNCILDKDLEQIRSILRNNTIDYTELYEHLFNNVTKFGSIGDAILLIGEHLYRDVLHPIKDINFIHMVMTMIKNGVI